MQQRAQHTGGTSMRGRKEHYNPASTPQGGAPLGQGVHEPPAVLYCMTRHFSHRSHTAPPPGAATANWNVKRSHYVLQSVHAPTHPLISRQSRGTAVRSCCIYSVAAQTAACIHELMCITLAGGRLRIRKQVCPDCYIFPGWGRCRVGDWTRKLDPSKQAQCMHGAEGCSGWVSREVW
jgi:hypothetical protein